MTNTSRTARVFVSLTFSDMHAEYGHILKQDKGPIDER